MENMPLLTVILEPLSSGPLSARLQLHCAGLDGRIWANAARKLLVEYAEYLWRRTFFFGGLPVGSQGRVDVDVDVDVDVVVVVAAVAVAVVVVVVVAVAVAVAVVVVVVVDG